MRLVDRITKVMDFSQTSLENTMDVVTEVHQTIIEIPINVVQELGFPEETSTALKKTHRRLLERIYGGYCHACGEVNRYIVKQAKAVDQLSGSGSGLAKPTPVKLDQNPDSQHVQKAG